MQTFAYVNLVLLYFAGVLCVFNALFECKNATFLIFYLSGVRNMLVRTFDSELISNK